MTVRMAGDDAAVARLLMGDKYRYLGSADYPVNEAGVTADDLSALEDFAEGRAEYQQMLEEGDFTGRPMWSTPESVQIEYEQAVKERLAGLVRRHPGVPLGTLLERAL